MKRILSLILMLCVMLCLSACKNTDINENTVVMPDSTTAETVNGYRSEKPILPEPITRNYVVNKTTKKFHLESCQYAKSTSVANLTTATDREGLITDGYSPCKKCRP